MKIRLTRNTRVCGVSVSVGDEVEVKERDGRALVAMGKAIEIETPDTDTDPMNELNESEPLRPADDDDTDLPDEAGGPLRPADDDDTDLPDEAGGPMDGLIEKEVIFDLPKARAPKKKK